MSYFFSLIVLFSVLWDLCGKNALKIKNLLTANNNFYLLISKKNYGDDYASKMGIFLVFIHVACS